MNRSGIKSVGRSVSPAKRAHKTDRQAAERWAATARAMPCHACKQRRGIIRVVREWVEA